VAYDNGHFNQRVWGNSEKGSERNLHWDWPRLLRQIFGAGRYRSGFKTFVILDACRGVELNPGDITESIEEMKKGVHIINSSQII
jgi:hypothetical protein